MQKFSWNIFSATGDVDAYLLYKDFQRATLERDDEQELSINLEDHEG